MARKKKYNQSVDDILSKYGVTQVENAETDPTVRESVEKRLKELDEENRKKTEDIAPVKTTTKVEEEKSDGLFSLFDDGWDQGDLIATIDKGLRRAGDWVGKSAMSGLASFNKSLTSTADVILGKPLQALGWKDNPVSKVADYYDEQYGVWKEEQKEAAEILGGGKGLNFAGEVIEGSVAALPDLLLATMTAGTSTATNLSTQAAYHGGNVLTKAGLTVEGMAKNPQFWMSFGRTYGNDYEEALNILEKKDAQAYAKAAFQHLCNLLRARPRQASLC